jgi:hypothetical protein
MTTYSENPLRILGLTVLLQLLSISEHIVPFCPQKVYKRYTKGIHQVYISYIKGGREHFMSMELVF